MAPEPPATSPGAEGTTPNPRCSHRSLEWGQQHLRVDAGSGPVCPSHWVTSDCQLGGLRHTFIASQVPRVRNLDAASGVLCPGSHRLQLRCRPGSVLSETQGPPLSCSLGEIQSFLVQNSGPLLLLAPCWSQSHLSEAPTEGSWPELPGPLTRGRLLKAIRTSL